MSTQFSNPWARYGFDTAGLEAADGRLPDFLVVSPPRTGSTWLAQQLRAHPDICVSETKELHYFDLSWRSEPLATYAQHFSTNAKVAGEATPTYSLLPDFAIRELKRRLPQLKLIFVLRRPSEQIWSHVCHHVIAREGKFSGLAPETAEMVSTADLLEDTLSDYTLAASDYTSIITRWTKHFDVGQMSVSFFDDIVASPSECLSEIFRFLGVDADVSQSSWELGKVNAGAGAVPPSEVAELMESIEAGRRSELAELLADKFGLTPPWPAAAERADRVHVSSVEGIYPVDIYLQGTEFHAELRDRAPLKSNWLGSSRYFQSLRDAVTSGRLVAGDESSLTDDAVLTRVIDAVGSTMANGTFTIPKVVDRIEDAQVVKWRGLFIASRGECDWLKATTLLTEVYQRADADEIAVAPTLSLARGMARGWLAEERLAALEKRLSELEGKSGG